MPNVLTFLHLLTEDRRFSQANSLFTLGTASATAAMLPVNVAAVVYYSPGHMLTTKQLRIFLLSIFKVHCFSNVTFFLKVFFFYITSLMGMEPLKYKRGGSECCSVSLIQTVGKTYTHRITSRL